MHPIISPLRYKLPPLAWNEMNSIYSDVFKVNREEKSLHHVAMVAKFLDDNKAIQSFKSILALFQTSPILFNLIWQNFPWDSVYCYLSLKQDRDNFCVLFTYSIKRACEIRKFPVL